MSRRRAWTDIELAILREHYPDSLTADIAAALGRTIPTVYNKAMTLGLRKTSEFLSSPQARRLDGVRGTETRFSKGSVPWNKGQKGRTGCHPNSVRTQFRRGERYGVAQHNYVPVGTERVTPDGYLERKVTDDPEIVPARRWVAVHRIVWEEARGPIPKGMVVCFLPGRRTVEKAAITIDALELVSRAELVHRNHPRSKSPELAELVLIKGAITRQVNRIVRQDKETSA